MGKRGPKAAVSFTDRLEELKKHEIFDSNGNLKPERDSVWKIICAALNSKNATEQHITVRNLQTYVQQNRSNILTILKKSLQSQNLESPIVQIEKVVYNAENTEANLIKISNDPLYKPMISELSLYPFSVFHSGLSAIHLLPEFSDISSFVFASVGSFCKNLIFEDGSTSEKIYLYTLAAVSSNELIPIFQLSAEQISFSLICRFFNQLLYNGLPAPDLLLLNHDPLLYTAANIAFNTQPYDDYLNIGYSVLKENNNFTSNCMICTDIELIICTVNRSKCLKNTRLESIRLFFLHCIVLLSEQSDINAFEDILEKIIVICCSPSKHELSSECFIDVKSKIKDLKIDINYNKEKIILIEDQNEIDQIQATVNINSKKVKNFLRSIYERATDKIQKVGKLSANERSAYYNTEFSDLLMQICMEFITWSKVIVQTCDLVKHNLSTLIQKHTEDFERYLLEKSQNTKIPVDEYLLLNVDFVNKKLEQLKLHKKAKNQSTKRKKYVLPEIDYLLYEENWKNKNKPTEVDDHHDSEHQSISNIAFEKTDTSILSDEEINFSINISSIVDSMCEELANEPTENIITPLEACRNEKRNDSPAVSTNAKKEVLDMEIREPIQRGKYLKPSDGLNLIEQQPFQKTKKRKVIKNYTDVDLKPRSVNGEKQIIKTTSYFDAIFETFTSAYFEVQKFHTFIDDSIETIEEPKQDFLLALKNYVTTFQMPRFYAERVEISNRICNPKSLQFSWTKPIGDFFDELLFANIFKHLFCNNCKSYSYEYLHRLLLAKEELITPNLSKMLGRKIQDCNYCKKCNNEMTTLKYEIKHVLCIDVEDPLKGTNKCCISLDNLVPLVEINKQKFMLLGTIGFQESVECPVLATDELVRHYVAYCRNVHGNWSKYDDSGKKSKLGVKKNKVINIALVIYIEYNSD